MTDESMAMDNGGRDWSGGLASQGVPQLAGKCQKPGRVKEGFSPTGFRGNMILPVP